MARKELQIKKKKKVEEGRGVLYGCNWQKTKTIEGGERRERIKSHGKSMRYFD